ncbi:MAG: hypothetical protein ACO1OK_08520, partial [Devosia sp.]
AALARRRAEAVNAAGSAAPVWIGAALLLHAGAIGALVVMALQLPDPKGHASGAVCLALIIYAVVHCGVGCLLSINTLLRIGGGFVSATRNVDFRLGRAWADFTLVTGVVALGLVLGVPALAEVLR